MAGQQGGVVNLSFSVPGLPKAKGRPRAGKGGRVFTPAKTRAAEEHFAALAVRHCPPEPLSGPLSLTLTFWLPVAKSWPRWKREAADAGLLQHMGKPDLDNLAKLAKDALNGLLWVDDSQVCLLSARKLYGCVPRTDVQVTELPQASGQ